MVVKLKRGKKKDSHALLSLCFLPKVPFTRKAINTERGFPGGSGVENPPAKAGGVSLSPGVGRSPGEGDGKPPQYPSLRNAMDRRAWQATVQGVTESWTQLSN